jgi:hypothetical protein
MAQSTDPIRDTIREELETLVTLKGGKLAYTLPEAAEIVSLSVTTLRTEIANHRLVPSYVGTKPILTLWELRRWLRALPAEAGRR